jgi:uncharacterized LabA/DUF88 family protein
MDRVVVFIDGGNFFNGVQELKIYFYILEITKLVEKLVDGRKLIRAYYYTVRPTDKTSKMYATQMSFLDQLERSHYMKVRYGRLTGNPPKEKGTDIFLAIDMLNLAYKNSYDTAILVSGDGDFVEVIESIQSMGKQVENWAFQGRKSDNLLKVCDSFHYIDQALVTSCCRQTTTKP